MVCSSCGHEAVGAFRFCPECGAPAGLHSPERERRKVVTVLFCDVVGSTALGDQLDPESLRALLSRYFDRMKAIVESHGGTVEKFIGDAVMAVFGVPILHEDDALRAVRAAAEMRAALPGVGVQGRIGIATGEVVTGTEERLATGDPINVAARLEQAAQAGEILIGAETLVLVRNSVDVEVLEPLELKGKPKPVPAYRLLSVRDEPDYRSGVPMVGRKRQLRQLQEAFAGLASGRCQLFTVLGEAGVGKSKLVAEFLAGIDAVVARGRCLPYGEGITYWPVVEVLKQLRAQPEAPAVAAALSSLLGETTEPLPGDEIAWAVRKTLEHAARQGPLVVVFDDIHWGEPAFLDLIEQIADLSRGAPILLLCMARPELVDRSPDWAGGKLNAITVLLEPLSAKEADELIGKIATLDPKLRERIRHAGEGNPLFLEEMLALLRDGRLDDVVVPPTIQALLTARLDQLDPAERWVLERGAVEGEIFHRGAVEALAPNEPSAGAQLMALVRKELVRPDPGLFPADDAYRFHHLLIRDAAYEGLPKTTRAELHQRFAAWLGERGNALVEHDELIGYHLEQACWYRAELGLETDATLAAEARDHLAAAGRRASLREDPAAARKLLGRVVALLPDGEVDLELELDLVTTLEYTADFDAAARCAATLAERCAAAGDHVGERCAQILELMNRSNLEPEGATDRLAAMVEEAIPAFEAAENGIALWTGYFALGHVARDQARMSAMLDANERALVLARKLGLGRHELTNLGYITAAHLIGPTSVPEILAWTDSLEAQGFRQSWVVSARAEALAMSGRVEEARSLMAGLRTELAERGATLALERRLTTAYEVELLGGDIEAAADVAGEHARMLEERGERASLSTVAARLGQALYALDRFAEADAEATRAAELGASDDALTQMLWRQVRAKVLARRGQHAEAETFARTAVELSENTDALVAQGDALVDLATVHTLAGNGNDAVRPLAEALDRYERKGHLVAAERTQALLVSLGA